MKFDLHERQTAIQRIIEPLPGSIPYENRRPLNVPKRFHGLALLDYLVAYHPHISREQWRQLISSGRILLRDQVIHDEQRIVGEGEPYWQRFPETVEPWVNAAIQILEEDVAIVAVNKPAPLPMHPCGRFNRNTLQSILDQVYRPIRLRIVHRLDANTSGLVLLAKTVDASRNLVQQFETRQVHKTYLARVRRIPDWQEFVCDRPIREGTIVTGARITGDTGQTARTEFSMIQRFPDGTALVQCHPITGRTNQIRVHLWDMGYPILGDPIYLPDHRIGETQTLGQHSPPLCLHAFRLQIKHPETSEIRIYEAPAPYWITP